MTPAAAAKKASAKKNGPPPHFRFLRRADGSVLVSNDSGFSAALTGADFAAFAAGKLVLGAARHADLAAKGFVRGTMDFEGLAEACSKRNAFMGTGPGLHILVMTLRCNHKCLYCQSSAVGEKGGRNTDMSRRVARKSVDFALQSTNPGVTIEFQGGEPLLNWETLKDAVLYARRRSRSLGRDLSLALVSNFSLMTEEKAGFLLENEVSICTSLDGPAGLHNRNRIFSGGNSHAVAVKWLKYFISKSEKQAPAYRVFKPSALLTVSKYTLGMGKEVIAEYVRLGLENIFLRPLAPIGYAKTLWPQIGYTAAEFEAFYRGALEHILRLNASGVLLREKTAVILLEKILGGTDPGYLDLRCPCGAGVGQVAYNHNGDLYTCDEGRMVGWEGDDLFRIGNVLKDSYRKVMLSPAVRACAAASNLELQPECSRCAYRPYCGVCPVYNYETQGSLWGNMPSNDRCALMKSVFGVLFDKMKNPRDLAIFKKWVQK